MIVARIAKAAVKIPWKRILQRVVPAAIDHVLDRVKRRKPRRKSSQKSAADPVAERIDKLEEDLESSLAAVRSTSDELARRIHDIGAAAQVLIARLTIALVVAVASSIIAIAALLIVLLRPREANRTPNQSPEPAAGRSDVEFSDDFNTHIAV